MLPAFDGFAEFMKGGYAKHSKVFYAKFLRVVLFLIHD